ncbi:hypothetical protein BH09ACT9_BH09ACT9_00220 [soil metagenome]
MNSDLGTTVPARSTPLLSWSFDLNYSRPPSGLSANDRTHYQVKARSTAQIRDYVVWRCRYLKVPALRKISVDVEWVVNTEHRRDTDNVAPLLKAIYDGIGADKGTSAHIVIDDAPQYMEKPAATIRVAKDERARFVVTITDLGATK